MLAKNSKSQPTDCYGFSLTLHLFHEKIDEAVLSFGYKPPRPGVLAEPVYFSIFIHFKSVYTHERGKECHKKCPAGWSEPLQGFQYPVFLTALLCSWLYGDVAKRGILKQITRLLWGESGHIFFVLSIDNKWWFAPYYKPYIYKKSGRAFAYPQARESKPYTHKQETPPAYRKEHFTVSCAYLNFRLFACTEIS